VENSWFPVRNIYGTFIGGFSGVPAAGCQLGDAILIQDPFRIDPVHFTQNQLANLVPRLAIKHGLLDNPPFTSMMLANETSMISLIMGFSSHWAFETLHHGLSHQYHINSEIADMGFTPCSSMFLDNPEYHQSSQAYVIIHDGIDRFRDRKQDQWHRLANGQKQTSEKTNKNL